MTGIRLHRQRPNTFCSMPSAAELHETGIHFQLSATEGLGGGITFIGGVLNIPKIYLDDNAERIFLNLMAFERLHPGAGNDNLRSKEIIKNDLGSDKAVADLINKTLAKGAVLKEDSSIIDVLTDVNAYYKKPLNKLRASFIHTYFSNPWVFFSLIGAVILLVATVMQTVYTIVPFYKNK
ncbi:Os11g0541300 [Oryza sativa Japonica Group]|uniref:Os11g0541300 protein n=2 Tax=Oryza sativa subsp. japonica TaxID=39947 RepID=Q2R317_ORYSJ|nr:hypothetical protein LOC_Os11g33950 [Oryza sativa Japonica Group]EAZ22885.1 hypothetical protein OsJ_06572 [Oryza sativa Japonica Group]BAT14340.1 Os11g0541300 [Oryza sativa Japonica Group]